MGSAGTGRRIWGCFFGLIGALAAGIAIPGGATRIEVMRFPWRFTISKRKP
jgi:hypothetical protein